MTKTERITSATIIAALLTLLLCSGCSTTTGPCKHNASRYEAHHRQYGRPVGTVYYFIQHEDGSAVWDEARGQFIAHALNYWASADGERTYLDTLYDPPMEVDAPVAELVFYDSAKAGTAREQTVAYLDALNEGEAK